MKKIKIVAASFFVLAASLLSWVAFVTPQSAHADYDNNNIMSDAVFDDTSTMSAVQIQQFLNSFPNSCLRNYQAPMPIDYFNYGPNDTAANIISKVSTLWRINPRVILVTLEKEEGLVSGNAGCDAWRYNSAVGMGCPDGGTCPEAPYAGFSQQVTKGMWQLQFSKYRSYGDLSWGDNGSVYYSGYMTAGLRSRMQGQDPVSYDGYATIDGASVYMSNGATAALYTYTPHFSGNQHFVTIFNSWFGSTQVSDLDRTVGDSSVYLVSGDNKYPISDIRTLGALYPLGNISYVDQSYLDSKTTGAPLTRAVTASNGTIYFFDAGIKLPFGSCSLVSDYGYTCGHLPQLTDYQINALSNGPSMTNLFGTTSGKLFYVSGAMKKEVYDAASLTQAGINGGANTLNEAAIGNLPYGAPVIRDNVLVRNRVDNSMYAYSTAGSVSSITTQLRGSYLDGMNLPSIDPGSINAMTKAADTSGYVQGATSGSDYILTSKGKLKVTNSSDWSNTFSPLPDALLNQIPDVATSAGPYTVMSDGSSGTIYWVTNKTSRPISSWSALLALNPTPNIISLPPYYLNSQTAGSVMLTPGTLAISQDNPTVYLVDGTNKLIPMGTFDSAIDLGFGPIAFTTSAVVNSYVKSTTVLSSAVQCGSNQGLAMGGSVYPVTLTGATYTTLSAMDCSLVNWKSMAPSFLLASSGTIFHIQNGQKQPISSYDKYLSLGGNGANTIRASNYALQYFTSGPLL